MKSLRIVLAVTLCLSWGVEAIAGALTFRELKEEILAHHITSTEQFLAYCARSPRLRELIEHPVLEETSGAIHGGEVTAEFPRVVLHEGNLTLHFIGDFRAPSHEMLELIEYLPTEGRFEFRLINFALSTTPLFFLENPDRDLRPGMAVRKAYDASVGPGNFECSSCHRAPPSGGFLPVWYPRSSLFRPFGKFRERILFGTDEWKRYQRFQRTLRDPDAGRFYRPLRLHAKALPNGDIDLSDRPNARLTAAIFAQAFARVAIQLQRLPHFDELQFAMMGSLLGCGEVRDFLPSAYRASYERRLSERLGHTDLAPAVLAQFMRRQNERLGRGISKNLAPDLRAEHEALERDFVSPEYLSALGSLFYLFRGWVRTDAAVPLEVLGEIFDATGTPDVSYRFGEGMSGLHALAADYLGPGFLRRHPELDSFSGHRFEEQRLKISKASYCERLKAVSLSRLSQN